MPDHPVYLQVSFAGPGATNSVGRDWFEANTGVVVAADGSIAQGFGPNSAGGAFAALQAAQTFDDKKRTTRSVMQYSASLGLTAVIDHGGLLVPAGAGAFDPIRGYDALLDLARAGEVITRVRTYFISADDAALAAVNARIDNAWRDFGDGFVVAAGLGEEVIGRSRPNVPAVYADAVRRVAQAGWSHSNHSSTPEENDGQLDAWEQLIGEGLSIADLHWTLEHVFDISNADLARVAALGAGVGVQNQRYLNGSGPNAGPPFRRIVDSGVPAGAGTDATNVAPINPWLSIYYMVTGRNSAGIEINQGQTISRLEALRLYTLGSAWVSREENKLGSIEVGKLADLAVLSDDFLSVPDEALRDIRSVLTVVGGRVVYSDGTLDRPHRGRGDRGDDDGDDDWDD